ncbi:sugar phosphate isomerase/epimerase [uncultured Paludibaculum sp.]|uniref:sugar phosphate isomerase/epimerase family protein n=1 Tax=uncultured Paludibaculum sp. TaxID=1765020 RepID=UPI002AAA8560|nr:sugar phosphate isomerase/epimerase [uncultured Paludibaculum sp.]
MQTLSRRQCLGALAAGAAALQAEPAGMPAGFQVYPLRQALAKDFPGTLRQMAEIGYKTTEMCSPPGYVSSGFGGLVSMPASEMKKIITDAGLRCESCHYGAKELKENLDERIAFAKELGLKQMILSSFGLPQTATLDDWKKAADGLNTTAAKMQKAGIQCGFHNHNGEFKELEGVLIYDELMRRLDPKLVKMQFQVAVVSLGFQAATYMQKYPGRILSLHLADWDSATKKSVAVGKGVVDWKQLFAAAHKSGVKNYFVEVDFDAMQESYPFLQSLKV